MIDCIILFICVCMSFLKPKEFVCNKATLHLIPLEIYQIGKLFLLDSYKGYQIKKWGSMSKKNISIRIKCILLSKNSFKILAYRVRLEIIFLLDSIDNLDLSS